MRERNWYLHIPHDAITLHNGTTGNWIETDGTTGNLIETFLSLQDYDQLQNCWSVDLCCHCFRVQVSSALPPGNTVYSPSSLSLFFLTQSINNGEIGDLDNWRGNISKRNLIRCKAAAVSARSCRQNFRFSFHSISRKHVFKCMHCSGGEFQDSRKYVNVSTTDRQSITKPSNVWFRSK